MTLATGVTSFSGSYGTLPTCGNSVRGLIAETASVYPSAGDFAMASMPIAPPAPPLFSTITCWPSCAESLSASGRATPSLVPPGG